MAQFTSSKTTGGGVVVNAVVDTTSNTTTYTVTAPNGAVATASQNTGSLNPATISSIQTQLNQGGADAQTFSIGLTTALSSTERNASEQAATAPPSVAETQSIPVSTATNPQVPPPTNESPNVDWYDAPTVDSESDALRAAAAEADARVAKNNQEVDDQDPFEAARLAAIAAEDEEPRVYTAEDLGVEEDSWLSQKFGEVKSYFNRATLQSEEAVDAASQAATIAKAKNQATLQARYKQPGNADWRVRLVLAEGSDYLYKAKPPGILKPLADSNGVIFPYTPQISTAYTANYDKYDLVHSNYRGYFYKNSAVNDVNITATFTAQDTNEAQYLLAVIHFFRSVTKMFYGKDAQRGAPPPLVYLVGYGDFQFNGHPCVVSNFNYSLPSDVDYIRANNPNNYGSNMLNRINATTSPSNIIPASVNRLANAIDKLGNALINSPGGVTNLPSPSSVPGSVNNLNRSTYVPTKMEISITLLPVQTRAQVSQQFSLKNFANGQGLKGGFW